LGNPSSWENYIIFNGWVGKNLLKLISQTWPILTGWKTLTQDLGSPILWKDTGKDWGIYPKYRIHY